MGNFVGKNVSTPKNYLTPKNNLFTSAELAKRIVIVCIEGAIMGFVLWKISEFMDPTYQAKKEAKARLEELRKKLQLDSNISFNSYEVRMASQLVFPDDGTDLDEVGGYSDILKQITDNVIVPLRLLKLKINFPSAYYSSPKGILMYGPPGCGKTLIARAIAKEVDAFFINFDISTLNDMWYGETSKLTKALFTLSQKIQPCIIFIDEIDAVLRNRSSNDHEATTTMKTQFMALWDGFSQTNSAVLIIGATNRPQDVDPAILRRLPFKIHVPKPDIKSREDIIRVLLRSEQIDPAFDYLEVAKNTESMSGSDLKECVRLACLHKYRDAFNSHKRSAGNLQDKINVIKLSHDDLINAAKIMGKSNELRAFEMVNCPITLD